MPATDPQPPDIIVNVNDVKQWAYCPRVVHYQRLYPAAGAPTPKMEMGHNYQHRIRELLPRRTLRPFGFIKPRMEFERWLEDPVLGLQGKADLVLYVLGKVAVVDFKFTGSGLTRNIKLQLTAYSLLIEARTAIRPTVAFMFRIPDNEIIPLEIDQPLREETIQAVHDIRKMIRMERLPPPTANRRRCVDCEFANLCADIW
jgi:CRISPR-associated exonuclease Cas4